MLGAGPGRRLKEFVTAGLTPEERAAIGDLPRGHGILGVIIDRPEPLRLPVLGDDPSSYGFPPNHPPMQTFLGVPIRIRDRVFGNLYLTEKRGGGLFTAEDEGVVVALAAAAGVVIENARLYEETARRQRWLEAAAEVTSALLTETERGDKLRRVAVLARQVPGADTAAVLLAEEDGRLRVVAVDGLPEDDLLGTALEVWGSHLADVLADGGPLALPDIAGDDRVPHELLGPDGSLLLVPLRTTLTVSGVLAIGWSATSEQAFRDTDVRLVEAYADQAALAMQVAQAREDRSRLAVFEDRDRIGRDLHDLVIQRLFAIGLTLENAAPAGRPAGGGTAHLGGGRRHRRHHQGHPAHDLRAVRADRVGRPARPGRPGGHRDHPGPWAQPAGGHRGSGRRRRRRRRTPAPARRPARGAVQRRPARRCLVGRGGAAAPATRWCSP